MDIYMPYILTAFLWVATTIYSRIIKGRFRKNLEKCLKMSRSEIMRREAIDRKFIDNAIGKIFNRILAGVTISYIFIFSFSLGAITVLPASTKDAYLIVSIFLLFFAIYTSSTSFFLQRVGRTNENKLPEVSFVKRLASVVIRDFGSFLIFLIFEMSSF
ncbi:hypothetical protein LACPH_000093 [Lacticaseibacillus parahuelsenbergensis]|uniref:Uncharacterized protein n=1 Tax=Lacticaseibacillus parahuelsenbergensis TaxID=3068305 RepID=A0ABY9L336_9LACO|nr:MULTISPECIES: hypothetical protein [Lacticaseibacillus]MDE3281219.1 hypothetical protein [Lacticaseibacillus casei]WLV78146.1 hypothetical protein LACPH_000093 [Lacticaseibacillus sp. NCIMB 15471]